MAITIGSTSFSTLTAQPFGYEETDTQAGQTARKWTVTGLLRPSEWLSLLNTYDTWRNTRINDAPTESSEVVGTTVAFTGDGPGGQSWTGVACWFLGAPQAEQSGNYLSATVELVDANQALAVLLKTKEQEEDAFDYGPVTIGGTSFPNLTAQPIGYEETDTRAGYTAKKWLITGILTSGEWSSLLNTYNGWRNTRIEDEPSEISGVVGTTISLSGSATGSAACWFIGAPQAERSGDDLSATVELVDAAQALEVLLKAKEAEEAEDAFDYGPVTIGGASFPNLTAQPIGYEETDTRAGYTAKKWLITGVLTSGEWSSLLSTYNGWRNARIEDEPSEISGVVGTTISLSGTSTGSAACWFIGAPQAERSGAELTATIELVDAAQALEVLLKAKEDEGAGEDLPDLGTITIGSTVLTLLKPVDAYATSPTMELTATGTHYIQGALVPYNIKDVEGTTNSAGWTAIRAWYETQITAVPVAGSYFPITSPTASAANKVVAGVTTVEYTVSIQLGLVL